MIITSEQVGRGHPDKICDQVSDFILNYILTQDDDARVAIESMITNNYLFISGEIKTNFILNNDKIEREVRNLLISINKDYENHKIVFDINLQSQEITKKVEGKITYNAGDQGLVFGYATSETNSFLPIPFALASYLTRKYDEIFDYQLDGFNTDSKAQVSYDYKKKVLLNINFSAQHKESMDLNIVRSTLKDFIIKQVKKFEQENDLNIFDEENTKIYVNHGGSFVKGGSFADVGLTGRKIVSDTYGGLGRVGGGCFSGKDYTKVDRSGAYYARYIARKIVELRMADICEIQFSFIIGKEEVVDFNIDTFDSEKIDVEEIKEFIKKNFPFTLGEMIHKLNLKKIDYTLTTLYGHFGKSIFKWG